MTLLSRFSALRLLAVLALLAPAFWSCNTESPLVKAQREQLERFRIVDEDTIQHYLLRNNITNYERLESGLYLVPLAENPQGTPVTAGRQVVAKYIGRFLSNGGNNINNYPQFRPGAVFDNSSENQSDCGCATFTAGAGTVAGFTEGLLTMRVGERKLFIIPSRLGYGTAGQVDANNIPVIYPNSVLLFDVEVLEVNN